MLSVNVRAARFSAAVTVVVPCARASAKIPARVSPMARVRSATAAALQPSTSRPTRWMAPPAFATKSGA
ncbi:hypothetical protein [Pseudonocardia sp. ICBG601]|uniref:hypothetical protein n=1 Tax=Pseudonocardia sp. ICBG601 TaxID=2846759 RepID=UPI001CF6E227|nr:hypothetical protein [Pseudonocardia sp. ICBG601]